MFQNRTIQSKHVLWKANTLSWKQFFVALFSLAAVIRERVVFCVLNDAKYSVFYGLSCPAHDWVGVGSLLTFCPATHHQNIISNQLNIINRSSRGGGRIREKDRHLGWKYNWLKPKTKVRMNASLVVQYPGLHLNWPIDKSIKSKSWPDNIPNLKGKRILNNGKRISEILPPQHDMPAF